MRAQGLESLLCSFFKTNNDKTINLSFNPLKNIELMKKVTILILLVVAGVIGVRSTLGDFGCFKGKRQIYDCSGVAN
jgi:hypothetical protein